MKGSLKWLAAFLVACGILSPSPGQSAPKPPPAKKAEPGQPAKMVALIRAGWPEFVVELTGDIEAPMTTAGKYPYISAGTMLEADTPAALANAGNNLDLLKAEYPLRGPSKAKEYQKLRQLWILAQHLLAKAESLNAFPSKTWPAEKSQDLQDLATQIIDKIHNSEADTPEEVNPLVGKVDEKIGGLTVTVLDRIKTFEAECNNEDAIALRMFKVITGKSEALVQAKQWDLKKLKGWRDNLSAIAGGKYKTIDGVFEGIPPVVKIAVSDNGSAVDTKKQIEDAVALATDPLKGDIKDRNDTINRLKREKAELEDKIKGMAKPGGEGQRTKDGGTGTGPEKPQTQTTPPTPTLEQFPEYQTLKKDAEHFKFLLIWVVVIAVSAMGSLSYLYRRALAKQRSQSPAGATGQPGVVQQNLPIPPTQGGNGGNGNTGNKPPPQKEAWTSVNVAQLKAALAGPPGERPAALTALMKDQEVQELFIKETALRGQLNELQNKAKGFQTTIDEQKLRIIQLEGVTAQSEQTEVSLRQKLEDAESNLSKFDRDLFAAEKSRLESDQKLFDATRREGNLEESLRLERAKASTAESELGMVRRDLEAKSAELKNTTAELNSAKSAIVIHEKSIRELTAKLEKATNKNDLLSQNAALEKKALESENQLSTLRTMQGSLQQELAAEQSKGQTHESTIRTLNTTLSEVQSALADGQTKLKAAEGEMDVLKAEKAEIATKRDEFHRLWNSAAGEATDLRTTNATKEAAITGLAATRNSLEREIRELKEQLKVAEARETVLKPEWLLSGPLASWEKVVYDPADPSARVVAAQLGILSALLKAQLSPGARPDEYRNRFFDELRSFSRVFQTWMSHFEQGHDREAEGYAQMWAQAITQWALPCYSQLNVIVPQINQAYPARFLQNISPNSGHVVSAVRSWIICNGSTNIHTGEVETGSY